MEVRLRKQQPPQYRLVLRMEISKRQRNVRQDLGKFRILAEGAGEVAESDAGQLALFIMAN
jgi:hypothetical protein